MKIKLERSGGFAGITSSNEMDTDKLPSSLQNTVKDLLDKKELSITKDLRRPKGAADYLNYTITIQDGKKDHVIECNEFNMDSTVKSLISFVQKNSKKD
jgi:hypothetical protein